MRIESTEAGLDEFWSASDEYGRLDYVTARTFDMGDVWLYGVPFPFEHYEKMAERLRTLKGRAIVSLNDYPEIRRVFDGFHIETVPIQYTVGLEAASRHEVIISSWDVGAEPAGLF